jgi:beta-mannosidase
MRTIKPIWSIFKVKQGYLENQSLCDSSLLDEHTLLPHTMLEDPDVGFLYISEFFANGYLRINFDGLAGYAQVFINGEKLLESLSFFRQHQLDYYATGETTIRMHFESALNTPCVPASKQRWKQHLADDDRLRQLRTTFLGHMPGWTQSVNPIGPYRDVRISEHNFDQLEIIESKVQVQYQTESSSFLVNVNIEVTNIKKLEKIKLTIAGKTTESFTFEKCGSTYLLQAEIQIIESDLELWYPHTHGSQPQYLVMLETNNHNYELSKISFRHITVDYGTNLDNFKIFINDKSVFCRGACWTSAGITNYASKEHDYRRWLEIAKTAGINMIRVGGTMLYEGKDFYNLCDELGIMVWQDFMLSNFDYPKNEEFCNEVKLEATSFLDRTSHNCCITVLCGGSEVFQQAAMFGLTEARFKHVLYDDILPTCVSYYRPDIPYVINSPSKGTLPFHTNQGISHYYGVGAYLRDLSDLRRADVKFAAECLAIANIPCSESVKTLGVPAVHHPKWKIGVPRDNNVSWDFEDVRDHYLKTFYEVDPNQLRREDSERYLELSRAVSHDLIVEAYSEWRSTLSNCGGALIWQLQDVQEGSGWGIIDNAAQPKAAFYAAQKVFKSRQILITDEGLNGLAIHIINETTPVNVEVHLMAWNNSKLVMRGVEKIEQFFGTTAINSNALLQGFFDINYAYRFGPLAHDIVTADLIIDSKVVSRATYCVKGRSLKQDSNAFDAKISKENNRWMLTVNAHKFCRMIHCEIPHFRGQEEWIDLLPSESWSTLLLPNSSIDLIPKGLIVAINAANKEEATVSYDSDNVW